MASIYDINIEDVLGSYNLRRILHTKLNEEFNKEGQIYGGRSFFTEFDLESGAVKTINFGSDTILPKQSGFAFKPNTKEVTNASGRTTSLPYGVKGLYKKLDSVGVKITQRVLSEYYDELLKAVEKDINESFTTHYLTDDVTGIMLTKKLIYDVKSAKDNVGKAQKIVKDAVKRFKKEYEERLKYTQQESYILSMNQLVELGQNILARSTELCPIETGFLRSSGTIYVFKDHIKIIYRCPYAVYVHENVNAEHPFGQAKFLETAVQEILTTKSIYVNIGDISGEYANFEWLHYGSGQTSNDAYLVKRNGYTSIFVTIDRNLIVNRSDTL